MVCCSTGQIHYTAYALLSLNEALKCAVVALTLSVLCGLLQNFLPQ